MQASPSPILSWIRRNPRASLGGKVLVPPKRVWLEEDPASESSVFTIYQVYENLVRRFLKKQFGGTAERELDRIRAVRNAKGIALSRDPWDLPEVKGLRLRAAYVFRTEQAEESPHLFAHRLGSPELNIEPNAPTPIGQAGLGWLRGRVKFATDPRVKVRPVVPWEVEGLSLRDYVREVFAEIVPELDVDVSGSDFEQGGPFIPTRSNGTSWRTTGFQ